MVVRSMGAAMLAQLMRAEREGWPMDWLLFGPDDPEVVERDGDRPPLLLAAE